MPTTMPWCACGTCVRHTAQGGGGLVAGRVACCRTTGAGWSRGVLLLCGAFHRCQRTSRPLCIGVVVAYRLLKNSHRPPHQGHCFVVLPVAPTSDTATHDPERERLTDLWQQVCAVLADAGKGQMSMMVDLTGCGCYAVQVYCRALPAAAR